MPFPSVRPGIPMGLAALGIATLILTIPFIISGVVVTIALTRTGHKIGWLYGADLIGAAAGCLVIIALLEFTDITSTAFAAAALAAVGAFCFARYSGTRGRALAALAVLLFAAMGVNATSERRLGVMYPKSRTLWGAERSIESSEWNAHSNVVVRTPTPSPPFYWGAAEKRARNAGDDGAGGDRRGCRNGDHAVGRQS